MISPTGTSAALRLLVPRAINKSRSVTVPTTRFRDEAMNISTSRKVQTGTTHVRWFLVLWIFVLSAIAFLDRVNISIAGPSIAAAYHLSNVQLGAVFSALLWGYAIFQTVGGRLADRIGPRRADRWRFVLGNFHRAYGGSSFESELRSSVVYSCPILAWGGRSGNVPRLEPICLALGFRAGTWFGKRFDLCRGWVGAGLSPPLITYLLLHHGWRASFRVCAEMGLISTWPRSTVIEAAGRAYCVFGPPLIVDLTGGPSGSAYPFFLAGCH